MSAQQDPSAYLLSFLTSYTQLVEKELLDIREGVVNTVQAVMDGMENISKKTEEKKQEAEEVLEFTYLHPDAETEVLIQDIQKVADDLFEKVTSQLSEGDTIKGPLHTDEAEVLVRNRISRFSAKLSESKGRLSRVDDELSSIVFAVIGSLSSEDVISQRLEHVILSLKSLQTGLSYILIDYDQRCRTEELERVIRDIKSFTYRQYTSEEEKALYHQIFGKAQ